MLGSSISTEPPYVQHLELVSEKEMASEELDHVNQLDHEGNPIREITPFMLYSTRQELPSLFEDGKAEMVSGRGFSEEALEEGKKVIIIHEELAEKNGVSLGDDITFVSYTWPATDALWMESREVLAEEKIYLSVEVVGMFRYIDQPQAVWSTRADPFREERNHAFIPDPLSVEHKEKIYEAELASVERGEWDDEYLPPMLRVFYSAYFTLKPLGTYFILVLVLMRVC